VNGGPISGSVSELDAEQAWAFLSGVAQRTLTEAFPLTPRDTEVPGA
jgi:hypothetical protein